jgi:DNA-binding NtrC family response regulator
MGVISQHCRVPQSTFGEEGAMNCASEVVVVSADLENRHTVAATLSRLEVDAICIPTVEQYQKMAGVAEVKLVFCERHLPDGDYRDVLAATVARPGKIPPKVVVMARHLDSDSYHQAKKAGIFDAIAKPCRPTDIEWMLILAKKQDRMLALAQT